MSRDTNLKKIKKYRTLLLFIFSLIILISFTIIIYFTTSSENTIILALGITLEIIFGAIFEVFIIGELFKDIKIRRELYSTIWTKASKIKPIHILGEVRSRKDKGFYEGIYFKDRDEEKEFHESVMHGLEQLDLNEYKKRKNILIIGSPLSGKSRMIYQWLKEQEKAIVSVLKPADQIEKIYTDFRLVPFALKMKNKKIVIIDNLHTYVNIKNFGFLIRQFLNLKTLLIITNRSSFEFDKIKRKSEISSFIDFSLFKKIHIKRIDNENEKTYQLLKQYISTSFNKKFSEFDFDGNIGSIFLDLHEIRNRYEKLCEENPKIDYYLETIAITYAFNLFYGEGAFPKEWLFNIYTSLFYNDIEKGDLLDIIKKLLTQEIAFKEDKDTLYIEPVYIEKIFQKDQFSNIILEKFAQIVSIFEDNHICLSLIGSRCFEIYSSNQNEQILDIGIICFELIINKDNLYSSDILLNLGNAYSVKKKFKKGVELYLKCLAEQPDYIEAYIGLGANNIDSGNAEEGIKYLEKAQNLGANNFELWYAFGNAYRNLLDFDKAIDYYIKALERKPDAINALTNLIIIYAELEDLANALKYFEITINLEPMSYEAYVNIGLAYSRKNKIKKAIHYYETAFKINPERFQALTNLGTAYSILEEYEKSISYYEKALKIEPSDIAILSDLNHLYGLIGDKEKAKKYLEIIIKTNPKDLTSVLDKAIILARNEEYQIALNFLNEITAEYKNEAQIYFVIARIYSILNKKNEAIKNLKKAIKLNSIAKKYAKELSDFDNLRKYADFKKLLE